MTHLIVDTDAVARVQQAFPSNTVHGVLWYTDNPLQVDAAPLRGQEVIVWAEDGEAIARDLCGIAAKVGLVDYAKTPMDMDGHLFGLYVRTHVQRYTLKAAGTTQALNGHATLPDAAAEPPSAPERVVERPKASVTPITEARTRQQAVPVPLEDALPAKYSHDALAAAFTAAHASWRHVADWGKWLHWNGQVWQRDGTLEVFHRAREVCREQAAQARADDATPTTVRAMLHANTIAAVERLARADRVHARSSDTWDADPWLLNTPGGLVDLRTGSVRPARPEDHCTRLTRAVWDADAKCPAWMEFLQQTTAGDVGLMTFLQRMAGYCLTGSVRDHALFFVHGKGGNGKGTFLNTLTWVMGDYADVASMSVFMEQKAPAHKTELASLMGKRLISAQEVEEGARWAEARINALTGGDPIRANFMRQDEFTFLPQFKLIIVGNHKPIFRNVGDAIRRRLHLIPFTHKPAVINACLSEQLHAEAAGILRWAVAGCLAWQQEGLNPPPIVKAATDGYLTDQDLIETWKNECCEVEPGFSGKVKDIYASYQAWCQQNGEYGLGRKRFTQALETRGHASVRAGSHYVIQGLRLSMDPAQASWTD